MSGKKDDYWDKLINEHGSALLLYARQWTNSFADAEDLVQKAVINFWRSRHKKKSNPAPYLFRSVRNASIDLMRSRKRRDAREEKAYEFKETVSMFEPRMEQEERREEIERALGCLPEDQKEVLVMKIWGDLTFKEIAKTLGDSPNTVASRYRYGLTALRDKLRGSL